MTRMLRRCRIVAAGAAVAGLLSVGLAGLSATPASADDGYRLRITAIGQVLLDAEIQGG